MTTPSSRSAAHQHTLIRALDPSPPSSDEDDQFYVIGDRVLVDNCRLASVAYFGETEFGGGNDWVGVVLDEPTGQHDGKYRGREYFHCAPKHGLFVRASRVRRLPDSALGSSAASSRPGTPLRSGAQTQQRANSASGRCSSTGSSYFYDDDYRRAPSAASLERKLRSLGTMQPSVGILKSSAQVAPSDAMAARVRELNRRLADTRAARREPPVDSFRPKRQQLPYSSSDNCQDEWQSPRRRAVSLSPSREPPSRGERVRLKLNNANESELTGTLRFMGETQFATGEWAGVELDQPVGKNDGSVLGQRYFRCAKDHGLFVPAARVSRLREQPLDDEQTTVRSLANQLQNFGTMRSTITSPPPPKVTMSTRKSSLRCSPSWHSSSSLSSPPTTPNQGRLLLSSYSTCASPDRRQYSASPASHRSLSSTSYVRADTPLSSSSSLSHGGLGRYRSTYLQGAEDTLAPNYYESETPKAKFDERDIEFELEKSLRKTSPSIRHRQSIKQAKPKVVTYTFVSSKYDGNPIVRRTCS